MADLTRAEKVAARELFEAGEACPDCGGLHKRACPRVRRQVWLRVGAGDGQRTEVEFWPTWDDSFVTYPEDAWDPDEGGDGG